MDRIDMMHGDSDYYEPFRHMAVRAFGIFASVTPGFLDLNDQQHYALCVSAATINTAANERSFRLTNDPDTEPSNIEISYSLEYGYDV